MKTSNRTRFMITCWVFAMAATACGNRMSAQQIRAENTLVTRSGLSATSAGAVGGPGSVGEQSGAPGAVTGPAGQAGGESGGGSVSPGQTSMTVQPGPDTGGTSNSATKAPIVIGFIATMSGFAGAVGEGVADGLTAWAKSVNANGGINGHPVRLLTADDGGDQSRAVAIAHDFVENKGAIALSVSASEVSGIAAYAKSKKFPVIGAFGGTDEWYTNPMMFFPYAYLEGSSWGAAEVLKEQRISKVATAYCVEAALCAQENKLFVKYANEIGLTVVRQQQISLTEPDYTAECLQLRNAGAQGVYVVGEPNSAIRLAQSCSRQGFKPIWDIPVPTEGMAKVPELQGSVSFNTTFPWFIGPVTPAVAEYRQAMQKYVPDRLGANGGSAQTLGWITAKTIEAAAEHVGDKPSSQDMLNGLWSLKGETLGGLAPGKAAITFTKGHPSTNNFCDWPFKIENDQWTAPMGMEPICR